MEFTLLKVTTLIVLILTIHFQCTISSLVIFYSITKDLYKYEYKERRHQSVINIFNSKLQRYDEAITQFEQVAMPSTFNDLCTYGYVFYKSGRYKESYQGIL